MRSYLSYIGGIVVIIGIYFIFHRFFGYFNEIKEKDFVSWSLLSFLFGLSLLYAALNLFLVMAWRNLLKIYMVDLSLSRAFKIYSSSQLVKYVPGNVLHIAGRQVLSMQQGLPLKPVMKSIVAELICLVITGSLFSLWYLPQVVTEISMKDVTLLLSVIFSVVIFLALKINYHRWLLVIFQQSLFLMVSGLLFYFIIVYVEGGAGLDTVLVVVSSYITAWLIGFVTPGAPAGVGVRETILLFLLSMFVPENILIAIICSRIVTVVGDLLFYIMSYAVKVPSDEF